MELAREACYVTAASATDKRQKHRQILVVPTPGGGARLAAIGRPLTLLRPTGRQQQSKSNKSSLSSGTKSPCELIMSRGRGIRGLSRSNSNVETRHKNSKNLKNNTTDPAQLLRQHQLQQMQLRDNYLKMKREEESIPEWKRKEDFFAALGLVTKTALKEIQNKKSERKRRTTANPQFSNAAIEAKRITAMEVAAKRARRREMAAAGDKNPPSHNNNRIPIMPQQTSLRSTIRPLSNQPSITSPMVSSSSHRQLLAPTNTLLDKCRHPIMPKIKTRNQFSTSRTPFNSNQSSSPRGTLPTSSVSSNSNPSSQATFVYKNMVVWSKIILKCADCSEECDPDVDAVVFCKDCRCYFHATCSSDPEEINLTNSVPCVSCPRIISVGGEGSPQASNELNSLSKGKFVSLSPIFFSFHSLTFSINLLLSKLALALFLPSSLYYILSSCLSISLSFFFLSLFLAYTHSLSLSFDSLFASSPFSGTKSIRMQILYRPLTNVK